MPRTRTANGVSYRNPESGNPADRLCGISSPFDFYRSIIQGVAIHPEILFVGETGSTPW